MDARLLREIGTVGLVSGVLLVVGNLLTDWKFCRSVWNPAYRSGFLTSDNQRKGPGTY